MQSSVDALTTGRVVGTTHPTVSSGCCAAETAAAEAPPLDRADSSDQTQTPPTTVPAETSAPGQPTADDPTASPRIQGQWSEVFSLANVAIHTHVLRNGKVLFWGRRKHPTTNSFESLNEHETHAFVFDPASRRCTPTSNQPVRQSGETINLFCSATLFFQMAG
jgi:hypothetical protein